MMVGRHLGDLYPPRASAIGDVVFACKNLSRFGAVRDVASKCGVAKFWVWLASSGPAERKRCVR